MTRNRSSLTSFTVKLVKIVKSHSLRASWPSRCEPVKHPRVRDRFAEMIEDADRPVEVFRQRRFIRTAKVAAPFEREAFFFQHVYRLVIRDPRERPRH